MILGLRNIRKGGHFVQRTNQTFDICYFFFWLPVFWPQTMQMLTNSKWILQDCFDIYTPNFWNTKNPMPNMVDVLAWYQKLTKQFSFNLRDSAWTTVIGIVRSTRSNDGMTCTVGECRVRWRCHSTQIRTVVGFWVSSCVQPNQDDNDSDQWNDETTRDTIRIELFHLLRETFSGSVGGSSFALCFNCANIRTSHSRKCSTIWILFISYSGLRTMLE